MRAYASIMKGGPLVFVVADAGDPRLRAAYINLAAADRPVKIAGSVAEARPG
jgi:hypothetical protein